MRLKKQDEEKVIVTVKSRTDNKSKSITIYDCTSDEVIALIKKAVTENSIKEL